MKNKFVFYTIIACLLSTQSTFSWFFCCSSKTSDVVDPAHDLGEIEKIEKEQQDRRIEEGFTISHHLKTIYSSDSAKEKSVAAQAAITILQRQLNEDHFLSLQKIQSKETLIGLLQRYLPKSDASQES